MDGENLVLHADGAQSIKYYVKVKGESSPFDGNEKYWSSRIGNSYSISKSILLKRQKGQCNLCKRKFSTEDIIEIDHRIPSSMGRI